MKHRNSVFHQLLKFLPRHRFQKTVDRHQGDRRSRSLSCWDQLVSMLFCQLSARQSLRDLELGFNSKRAYLYHLGTKEIHRSTLADANQKRPVEIFQDTFFSLLQQVRDCLPGHDSAEMVRLIDSTTIDLNLNHFQWAKFRRTKAGIKLHTVYDPNAEVPTYFEMTSAKMNDRKALDSLPILPKATYVVDRAYNDYGWYYSLEQMGSIFVGRMKTNARFKVTATHASQSEALLADETIEWVAAKAQKDCPIALRKISFRRAEDGKVLSFITNDFTRSAEDIAALYKQRWQIELFFKWIKQNLKIKQFLGRSENAVMIQVLIAMIAYLLLKLTQMGAHTCCSLKTLARLISINLMSRVTLRQLLHPDRRQEKGREEPHFQIDFTFFEV